MIWTIPFVLQGVVMVVDEIYCHRGRVLRRWERWGHPLDTVFYLACLLWILLVAPGPLALTVYAALSVGSSLFITKDEWQHRELCSGFENWLHSLLFLLHPLLLFTAGGLWFSGNELFYPVIGTVAGLSALFAVYQAVYWNFIRA
jgi:hypothetical protein